MHWLNVSPTTKPVKQKKIKFTPKTNEAIAEELDKLLKARFISEVHYPEWLASVVMVRKPNRKWRMCVNFTDLNKLCSKDSFPFSRIDTLVDSMPRHQTLSFMDDFSWYN